MSKAGAHRNIALFVPHAGCEHDCVFCDQRRISGAPRLPSPEDVVRACETAGPDEYPRTEIAFFGGSFTAIDRGYMRALLQSARDCVERFGYRGVRVSTRPDAVDEGIMQELARCRVTTVELGAQSMDDRVLSLCGRGHAAGDTERAAKLVRAAGVELVLQMMTGLPGDTPDGAVSTLRGLLALSPDGLRVYPTIVIKGTRLHDMYQSGEYSPQSLEDATSLCARLLSECMDAGVPVIRMGLHASDGLREGSVVAGPYHPAFGELVQSRLMLKAARAAILRSGVEAGQAVTLLVNPAYVSRAVGHGGANIDELARLCGTARVRVRADGAVAPFEVRVEA